MSRRRSDLNPARMHGGLDRGGIDTRGRRKLEKFQTSTPLCKEERRGEVYERTSKGREKSNVLGNGKKRVKKIGGPILKWNAQSRTTKGNWKGEERTGEIFRQKERLNIGGCKGEDREGGGWGKAHPQRGKKKGGMQRGYSSLGKKGEEPF